MNNLNTIKIIKSSTQYFLSLFIFIGLISMTACTSNAKKMETGNMVPQTAINFFDSEVFDIKLGLSLRKKLESVDIKVITPFSTNNIPKRLDKWLSAVSRNGGKVDVQADPAFMKTRGIISEIVDLIFSLYDGAKELAFYNATDNYDVVLYYKPADGMVTKLIFSLRDKKIQK